MIRALLERARACGVAVTIENFGWGTDALYSEYDPHGPAIRVNARVVDALSPERREAFVARAIAHELYHHREGIGEIARRSPRAVREREADAYATALVEGREP